MLTQERLKELLRYDEDSGVFYRRTRTCNRVKVGDVAGCVDKYDGYVRIRADGISYLAHRLAYLYQYGVFPPEKLDHKDCNRSFNKGSNLRLASDSENARNSQIKSSNKSGFKGVHFDKRAGKWRVSVHFQGKQHTVGYYEDLELAGLVATETRNKYHGEYARHV